MRVAVAGATGLVGRFTVAALTHAGHEVLELSRASGVDLRSRTGLAPHLDGASAVIDVTNTGATTADEVRAFFGTATRNLLEAEAEAGVGHHVLLSIVGMERIGDGNPHYAGKLLQEELVEVGPVPCT
ncbi:MAG: SDR family oxidoreductase, partial [Actinomycetota bacterium]